MALEGLFDEEKYLISKDGKVLDRLKKREVSKFIRNGYVCVRLKTINGYKSFYLHRILAELFVPNNKNLPCVNHIDGNKLNNTINNLEWCTYSDNLRHAYKHNLRHNAKTVQCVETGNIYNSVVEASKKTGIKRTALTECLRGRNKTCAKKHWKYISNN